MKIIFLDGANKYIYLVVGEIRGLHLPSGVQFRSRHVFRYLNIKSEHEIFFIRKNYGTMECIFPTITLYSGLPTKDSDTIYTPGVMEEQDYIDFCSGNMFKEYQ